MNQGGGFIPSLDRAKGGLGPGLSLLEEVLLADVIFWEVVELLEATKLHSGGKVWNRNPDM